MSSRLVVGNGLLRDLTRVTCDVGRLLRLVRGPRQPVGPAGALQHRQRLRLDLAHSLAGHPDLVADVLERHRALVPEPVAELDYATLAPGERIGDVLEVAVPYAVGDDLEREAGVPGVRLDESARAALAADDLGRAISSVRFEVGLLTPDSF
jgi:hypothetical protein